MLNATASAPAKLNLGLEIVGKRPDAYHEIVTVMQAIDLVDTFTWNLDASVFHYDGPPAVSAADDLVCRAWGTQPIVERWRGSLTLAKRIPVAAGLGGGSSNAALALRLAYPAADTATLTALAAALGADVPFFLRGGRALATGTGTTLRALSDTGGWFLLLTPDLHLPGKTARLYGGLTSADLSDGTRVRQIAEHPDSWNPAAPFPNAFARQLLDWPVVRYAYRHLQQASGRAVNVSGAGPTLFVRCASAADAETALGHLRDAEPALAADARIARARHADADRDAVAIMAAALRGTGRDAGR